MEARDFRNLTEAYYQVYQEQELDEAEGSYGQTPKATSAYQKLYIKREETPAKEFKRKKGGKTASTERARHHLGRSQTYGYAHSGKQSDYPTHATNRKKMTSSDRAYARQNDEFTSQDLDPYGEPNKPGGIPKGKKLERQRKTGVSAESYDLYDLILSHLLDEGYAETPEAAEVMMVNMSEDWREMIFDECELDEVTQRKSFKFQHRADELDALRHSRNKALKAGNTGEVKSIERWINEPNVSSLAQKERVRRLEKRPPSRLRSGSIPTQKESYDIYDLILSHLLDEGYAETPEAAEVIMVNMSEDWREMIFDECELDEAKIDDELTGQQKKDIRNKRSKFGSSSSSKSKKTKLRHDLHKKSRGVKKVPGDKSGEEEILVLRRSQRMHGTLPKTQKVGGKKGLPEQVDLYDLILSHLLDEGYAETPEAAEVIMVNMSEDWIDSILDEEYLYEMRKEDKVAGKKKTPLMVPGKRGTIQKTESGGWKKQTPMVGNPKVSTGRQRQGGGGWRELYGYQRHPHGGAHDGMGKGSERGKRLPKGLKPGINTRNVGGKKQVVVGPKAPKTPVERFKAQKQENEYVKNANYGSKTFRNYNTRQPSPTRLDVLRARRAARLAKKS